jgi:hypothetical protein
VALVRAASVDPIDDETTFTGVWFGNVHAMHDWMDCRSAQRVYVESDSVRGPMPGDSAFVLRGRYRHSIRQARPLPPEWNVPRSARPRPLVLEHAFVATALVGGADARRCPFLMHLRARGAGGR